MGIMGEKKTLNPTSCRSLCQATPLEKGISQISPPLASPYSQNAPPLGHYITHNGLDPPAEKHLGDNWRVKGSNGI